MNKIEYIRLQNYLDLNISESRNPEHKNIGFGVKALYWDELVLHNSTALPCRGRNTGFGVKFTRIWMPRSPPPLCNRGYSFSWNLSSVNILRIWENIGNSHPPLKPFFFENFYVYLNQTGNCGEGRPQMLFQLFSITQAQRCSFSHIYKGNTAIFLSPICFIEEI